MIEQETRSKPVRGMALAFKATASQSLAGIPATVIDVWPRFRSGDYLVTLEYPTPVKFRKTFIRRIDAFLSELEEITEPNVAPPRLGPTRPAKLGLSLPL